MNCIFESTKFEQELYKKIAPILKSETSAEQKQQDILQSIVPVAKAMGIDVKNNLDNALNIIKKKVLRRAKPEVIPSDDQIKSSLLQWKSIPSKPLEDTSSKKLTDKLMRSKENVFDRAFRNATYAKIRAKQQANVIGVHSILFDSEILANEDDINKSIVKQQELLLQKVLTYLQSQGMDISSIPNTVYDDDGYYTGVLEMFELEMTPEQLNKAYNERDYQKLDAYNAYVILNNFDTILKDLFGKAININPDASKFQQNKYSVAGGSNVYNTWRTSEEIDLSKEINNISQAIVTSIPYISKSGTTSSDKNLKFNEFCYIISKIKDIGTTASGDYIMDISTDNEFAINPISQETLDLVDGKSFLTLVRTLRTNPQKYLPALMELMNNDTFISRLIQNNVIKEEDFKTIDLDLINTIYQGLFNKDNENSLFSIQSRGKGFNNINYYSFITQTIDSMYKAGFLQYFKDPDGKLYVRNMYDQSISAIEWNIKDAINSINSSLHIGNYETIKQKYQIKTLYVDENTHLPTELSLIIPNFHRGNLEIRYNLLDGKLTYLINGQQGLFTEAGDYESLSPVIQDVLKQNFDLNRQYYDLFVSITSSNDSTKGLQDLMQLTSRVLFNQYISNEYLKNRSIEQIRNKLGQIFPDKSFITPRFNKRLNEIQFVVDADIDIISNLAQAQALITGKLTSSQILDGEGNALASNTLSRLYSTLLYQVEDQIKNSDSLAVAKEFSLWKPGVFKGIYQAKEFKDNVKDFTKSHIEFSASEMEQSLVFVDFVQGLLHNKKVKSSPIGDGVIAIYPSENSDKTYIGRMLVDLNNIKVYNSDQEASLYESILAGRTMDIEDLMFEELGYFYNGILLNINQEWNKVAKAIQEIKGYPIKIMYGDWSSVNLRAAMEKKTPLEYINDVVTEWNYNHPNNIITLTDQVHYVSDKGGNLLTNKSLLENISRFEDREKFFGFIRDQQLELLRVLLKDKLEIIANPDIEKLIGKEWIDSQTNRVILAKEISYNPISGENEVNNVRHFRDIQEGLEVNSVHGFKLNPLLESYNILNYLLTQEFMGSTVGAFYAHPLKRPGNNPLFDEKGRKLAQDKRNVSFTAAMHAFQQNLLQGVPKQINIAIMPDVYDNFQTISGDPFDIKPYDGATFANPFYGRMVNASLGGAKVGKNKKTFTHFYDEKTGTGGIIKTADFTLSNYEIRESKRYQIMMRNMTDRPWRDETGNIITDLNVLNDYNGNPIELANPNSETGQLFFKDYDGKNYAILQISYQGNNSYFRVLQEVDNQGNAIGEQVIEGYYVNDKNETIKGLFRQGQDGNFQDINTNEILNSILPTKVDTNYKLWKLFGGERALELRQGFADLTWSEHSLDLVYKIINNVGYKHTNNVRYQEDVFQPLKHSDIHLMPTIGAVKQGAANINSESAYTIADPSKIGFMKVLLNQSGIQLDKEHNADGEDLSIMTQVISACAARGYTQEQAQEMYNAMAALARAGISEFQNAFDELFKATVSKNASEEEKQRAYQKYQKVLQDTMIKALANSTNDSYTLQVVTQEILDKAREGKEFQLQDIPYSDDAIFRKLHSTIAVAMTRAAIKIKVDGILSVLCPTYGIRKIYGDKTLSHYNNDEEIIAEQREQDSEGTTIRYSVQNHKNDIGNLKLGRHYLITYDDGSQELRNIKTQVEYYKLKEDLKPTPSMTEPSVIENEIDRVPYDKKIQKAKQLGLNVNEDVEPQTVEEYVGTYFPKLTFDSIKKELGWSGNDTKRIISLLRSPENGGVSVQTAAERIYEELPEGLKSQTDDSEIRDIILDILQSIQTPNDITKIVIDNRIHEALEEYDYHYGVFMSEYHNKKTIVEVKEQFAPMENFEGGRELASYNCTFKEKVDIDPTLGPLFAQKVTPRTFNFYDLKSVHDLSNLKESENYTQEELNLALQKVQDDLNTLSGIKSTFSKNFVILDDGSKIKIDPNSVNVEPYEIIMPKIFAQTFGLNEYDDLRSIKSNPNFFTERLFEKISNLKGIPESNYSIGLMQINGKHIYLLNSQDAVESPTFRRKQIQQTRKQGKLYRQQNDELLYEMNESDEVWEQVLNDGTTAEVIITNDFEKYLDQISFNTLHFSNTFLDKYEFGTTLAMLQKSDNLTIKQYLNALEQSRIDVEGDAVQGIKNMQNIYSLEEMYRDTSYGNYLIKLGQELHTSFLKSLDVVAARVPAQSMQSFMPMKVVAFEAPDINTAYVATTQFLFQGSDLDIDAVSIAAYSFDRNGKYIIHSPLANTSSLMLLKASEKLPFPTGRHLEMGKRPNDFTWEDYIATTKTNGKPFYILQRKDGSYTIRLNNEDVESINNLGKLIRTCNQLGFIPEHPEQFNTILKLINKHNEYLSDRRAEDFSKNFIVTKMFEIGLSPANLIESQQAMDSITGPLKAVANQTIKALEETLDNPASFTTNIHGMTQNMAGKKGVGICAVGLKSYFALTARYNEVLNYGSPEELRRLESDLIIAGNRFKILANSYSKTEQGIIFLKEIVNQLDQGTDQALILSGLLSLATDNAKELALDKLNASNMLGMYIFGISIGMDFKQIADIIASPIGIVINEMMGSNILNDIRGKSMENIFDELEVGPIFNKNDKYSEAMKDNYREYLSQENLRTLAYRTDMSLEDKLDILEKLKINIPKVEDLMQATLEYNNIIEKAQEYVERIDTLLKSESTYEDLKKLYYGGEELRRLGQLLHINQGLETSYAKAVKYIETVTNAISDRAYSILRTENRKLKKEQKEAKDVNTRQYIFNFHQFATDSSYREACIDVYEGRVNLEKLSKDKNYAITIRELVGNRFNGNTGEISDVHKFFYNILDVLQVPHYLQYLQSADQLHQAMTQSAKYRSVYNLGRKAIGILRAFSQSDREEIFKKTEQMVNRLMRDRFLISYPKITIPEGENYFFQDQDQIKKKVSTGEMKIQLGTPAGNMSFKLLMETKIIPELIGMTQDSEYPEIKDNEFLKSLTPTMWKRNFNYQVTMNMAPNINMSPRSDVDIALFEKIKYDFNKLRTTKFRYNLGGTNFDLIELFWLYNQIAFDGRAAENSLTSVFRDVLDYKIIKKFRDFESQMDKEANFEETVSDGTLIREVALRRSPWNTFMSNFYYEESSSGNLSWWRRGKGEVDPNSGVRIYDVNGYLSSPVKYVYEKDLKNYVVGNAERLIEVEGVISDDKTKRVDATIQTGKLNIVITPLDGTPPQPLTARQLREFGKIPTKTLLTKEGMKIIYDIDLLKAKLKNLVDDNVCN